MTERATREENDLREETTQRLNLGGSFNIRDRRSLRFQATAPMHHLVPECRRDPFTYYIFSDIILSTIIPSQSSLQLSSHRGDDGM